MNLLILSAILALASAEKLDNTYLPPPGAGNAGGSPDALKTPKEPSPNTPDFDQSQTRTQPSYLPPTEKRLSANFKINEHFGIPVQEHDALSGEAPSPDDQNTNTNAQEANKANYVAPQYQKNSNEIESIDRPQGENDAQPQNPAPENQEPLEEQYQTAPGALNQNSQFEQLRLNPQKPQFSAPQSSGFNQFGQGTAFGGNALGGSIGFEPAGQQQPNFGGTGQQEPSFATFGPPAPSFGSTGQQQPSFGGTRPQQPSFGNTGPQQPSFGNTGPQKPSFGSTEPQQPSFGSTGPQQPSFGTFGRPAPNFGGTGQQQPSFGSFGQPEPSFESTGQQEPSFGTSDAGNARPQAAQDRAASIIRYDNQNDGERFSYSFETDNGISAEESGIATNGVQAQGAFSYTGDDGQVYSITYTADENGYQPMGDHLPTPPPIPKEILRALEINAQAEAARTLDDGQYNPSKYGGSAGAYNPETQDFGSGTFAQLNQNEELQPEASFEEPSGSAASPQTPFGQFQQNSPQKSNFNIPSSNYQANQPLQPLRQQPFASNQPNVNSQPDTGFLGNSQSSQPCPNCKQQSTAQPSGSPKFPTLQTNRQPSQNGYNYPNQQNNIPRNNQDSPRYPQDCTNNGNCRPQQSASIILQAGQNIACRNGNCQQQNNKPNKPNSPRQQLGNQGCSTPNCQQPQNTPQNGYPKRQPQKNGQPNIRGPTQDCSTGSCQQQQSTPQNGYPNSQPQRNGQPNIRGPTQDCSTGSCKQTGNKGQSRPQPTNGQVISLGSQKNDQQCSNGNCQPKSGQPQNGYGTNQQSRNGPQQGSQGCSFGQCQQNGNKPQNGYPSGQPAQQSPFSLPEQQQCRNGNCPKQTSQPQKGSQQTSPSQGCSNGNCQPQKPTQNYRTASRQPEQNGCSSGNCGSSQPLKSTGSLSNQSNQPSAPLNQYQQPNGQDLSPDSQTELFDQSRQPASYSDQSGYNY